MVDFRRHVLNLYVHMYVCMCFAVKAGDVGYYLLLLFCYQIYQLAYTEGSACTRCLPKAMGSPISNHPNKEGKNPL